jgi:hypothetical protein
MKQRRYHRRGPYDPQPITRAVTHIRLQAANGGKLTALDELAQVYLSLCQQYVTLCAQRGASLSVVREHDLTQAK